MRLRFLGVEYDYQRPSVETHARELAGKYRGVAWSTRHPHPALSKTEPITLYFMGRPYQAQV